MIQPKAEISACATGANRNCPNDPPALMKPEANERLSAGRRCAAAPIRIEKLPAPAPAALIVFPVWGGIGLVFYFLYGYRKSQLAHGVTVTPELDPDAPPTAVAPMPGAPAPGEDR